MSSTLVWRPVVPQEGRALPNRIKFILEAREDGLAVESDWGPQDLGYLEGLRDAGIDGAAEMIEAINKHHHIRLTREY